MVAGLEDISTGELRIGDRRVNDVDPQGRDIAMVFQSYALYPHMSVADNIGYGLKLRKIAQGRDEEADREGRRHARADAAAGPQARSSCPAASASASRWAAPSSATRRSSSWTSHCRTWTPSSGCRCGPRSRPVVRSLNTTTLYVTHDQTEAMTMGDRMAVMKAGVLQQLGSPGECYDKPDNIFVAQFVGSPPMNLVQAKVRRGAGTDLAARGRRV